jgi:hypothetical protein
MLRAVYVKVRVQRAGRMPRPSRCLHYCPLPVVASGLDGQATLKEEDGAASGKDAGGAGDCGCGTRPCYEVGVLEGPGPQRAEARFDARGYLGSQAVSARAALRSTVDVAVS